MVSTLSRKANYNSIGENERQDYLLLFHKKIQDYFYSIWWLHSEHSADNIRARNHYSEAKISNLIKFSNKNTSNSYVIQNNGSTEELKTRINKKVDKLVREISFSDIVSDVLSKHKNKTKIIFQHTICPDVIVGLNGEFWFDKQSRIKKLDIKETKKTEKTIIVILESPHVAEFKESKIPPNPALGKTGINLQKHFNAKSLYDLLGEKLSKKNSYRVILMNSIQFQCSLGMDTIQYRDHIWISCWYKLGCAKKVDCGIKS